MATVTFEEWYALVSRNLVRIAGVSADDLADQCWRDGYDDELTPLQAANAALESEGWVE